MDVKWVEDNAWFTAVGTQFFHAKRLLPMQVKFPREGDNCAIDNQ